MTDFDSIGTGATDCIVTDIANWRAPRDEDCQHLAGEFVGGVKKSVVHRRSAGCFRAADVRKAGHRVPFAHGPCNREPALPGG
jgi:hypothetical protein